MKFFFYLHHFRRIRFVQSIRQSMLPIHIYFGIFSITHFEIHALKKAVQIICAPFKAVAPNDE